MAIINYYEALGVTRDAAPATVRSAYKKLMLQCHPDKVRDETLRAEKAKQFREVQEAYEILSDARKRRKHDEELDRKGGATTGNGTSGSGEDTKRDKERERHERRRRRAEETEPTARRSRAEPSFNPDEAEREHRKAYREQRERERERGERERDRDREHHHRRDEVPLPKHRDRHAYSTTGSRYTEETPRKTSGYERPHPQEYPHAAPPPSESRVPPAPESEGSPAVRPGYEEKRMAEEAKLEAVRRRTREAQGLPTGTPRTHRSNSHESDKAAQAEEFRRTEQQRVRVEEEQRRERERRKQAKAAELLAERLGRPTDIPTPTARPRKTSASPLGRRRGSSISKDDFVFGTPPYVANAAKASGISGSVPTASAFGYGSPPHVGGPGYPQVRRRHSVSSPSLEKQAARPHRQAQPPPPQHQQDSGYSSPSSPNDASTPITFEKKHVPSNLNPGGSAIHQHQGNGGGWKKYIVYVQEDGTTTTAPPPGGRKTSSAGSPESSHAEPIHLEYEQPAGAPLPADFFIKAGLANGGNIFVQNAGYGIPGPGYAASATSHSSHSSPRVPPQRHHSVHQSPRMGGAGFDEMSSMHIPPSPGLSRASTTYSTPGSRRAAPVYASPGFPPAFNRGQTWNV